MIPLADTSEKKKLRRLAMLIRAASQSIESSAFVSDTIWMSDTETVCDALFRAADEILDVADCLPNAKDHRGGTETTSTEQQPSSAAPVNPLVGQAICPVCNKPISDADFSSTGYIDYHKECNRE